MIAIVQAIGRALRKRPNAATKTASIVIPVPVPVGEDPDYVVNDSAWATVRNVVTAMSQHDGQLAEHLEELKRALGPRRVPGLRTLDAVAPALVVLGPEPAPRSREGVSTQPSAISC